MTQEVGRRTGDLSLEGLPVEAGKIGVRERKPEPGHRLPERIQAMRVEALLGERRERALAQVPELDHQQRGRQQQDQPDP